MVKIGVIANNERLNELLQCIHLCKNAELSGVYSESTPPLLNEDILLFEDYEQLIKVSDAIYVSALSSPPFHIAQSAFRNGKHVFFEQISVFSVEEIEELLSHRKEANVKCMTGSDELSHPAFHAAKKIIKNPLLIESNREVMFDEQSSSNIILDYMLKDIAVIMNLVPGEIKRLAANGFKMMNGQIDVATTRLEFSNGCVAILTVNKSSDKDLSNFVIYEENQRLTLDLMAGRAFVMHRVSEHQGELKTQEIQIEQYQPLAYQLNNFIESISGHAEPMFKLREAYKKVDIATRILKKINSFSEE